MLRGKTAPGVRHLAGRLWYAPGELAVSVRYRDQRDSSYQKTRASRADRPATFQPIIDEDHPADADDRAEAEGEILPGCASRGEALVREFRWICES